ncbi:MAG: hypothetical protein ABL970_02165 [Nitrospira sp.]
MPVTPYSIPMGFDQSWFDTLRTISDSKIGVTRHLGIERRFPDLFELADMGFVPPDFVTPAKELIRELNGSPYPFGMTVFRAATGHIFTFPRNQAYHWQWNIAFGANRDPHHDHSRVGIGLYGPKGEEGSPAWMNYNAFQEEVRARRSAFTTLMQQIGDYREPEDFAPHQGHADAVVNDSPEMPFWRFFGACLRMNSAHDRALLSSIPDLVSYAVGIFKQIDEAGFYVDSN